MSKKISLSGSRISNLSLKVVFDYCSTVPGISEFDFSNIRIGSESGISFARLGSSLSKLNLTQTHISDKFLAEISSYLRSCVNLSSLILDHNPEITEKSVPLLRNLQKDVSNISISVKKTGIVDLETSSKNSSVQQEKPKISTPAPKVSVASIFAANSREDLSQSPKKITSPAIASIKLRNDASPNKPVLSSVNNIETISIRSDDLRSNDSRSNEKSIIKMLLKVQKSVSEALNEFKGVDLTIKGGSSAELLLEFKKQVDEYKIDSNNLERVCDLVKVLHGQSQKDKGKERDVLRENLIEKAEKIKRIFSQITKGQSGSFNSEGFEKINQRISYVEKRIEELKATQQNLQELNGYSTKRFDDSEMHQPGSWESEFFISLSSAQNSFNDASKAFLALVSKLEGILSLIKRKWDPVKNNWSHIHKNSEEINAFARETKDNIKKNK